MAMPFFIERRVVICACNSDINRAIRTNLSASIVGLRVVLIGPMGRRVGMHGRMKYACSKQEGEPCSSIHPEGQVSWVQDAICADG